MNRLALTAGALALVAAGAVAYYRTTHAEDTPTLVTTPVTRGDVVEAVDATGTLQAVTTVQVGTQVSGTIKAWSATVTPGAVLLAFTFAVAVGVFFGLYPARKAALLNPFEALRYE